MHDAFFFPILGGLLALSLGVFTWYVVASWRHWRQYQKAVQDREERYRQWGPLDDADLDHSDTADGIGKADALASLRVARRRRSKEQEP
ncbi:MAG: hypothetical protein IRZ31_20430 [Thermogemmatispora sp.]|uniref:hypothetical protein n=1 Tax=Thermogemmatispora sp. TaxID=1968838 RepID=UPI00260737D7|nr:hypothetical protein [Thermogemmatispora sp.]MBX5459267.1 hypothetical protein [Thermogemmatispora sp.]